MEALDFDDWEELMAEPPHGHNHGRKRGDDGGWIPLETPGEDLPSVKTYVDSPRKHGTEYVYRWIGCRCEKCRAWNAERSRLRRTDTIE